MFVAVHFWSFLKRNDSVLSVSQDRKYTKHSPLKKNDSSFKFRVLNKIVLCI